MIHCSPNSVKSSLTFEVKHLIFCVLQKKKKKTLVKVNTSPLKFQVQILLLLLLFLRRVHHFNKVLRTSSTNFPLCLSTCSQNLTWKGLTTLPQRHRRALCTQPCSALCHFQFLLEVTRAALLILDVMEALLPLTNALSSSFFHPLPCWWRRRQSKTVNEVDRLCLDYLIQSKLQVGLE